MSRRASFESVHEALTYGEWLEAMRRELGHASTYPSVNVVGVVPERQPYDWAVACPELKPEKSAEDTSNVVALMPGNNSYWHNVSSLIEGPGSPAA